LTASGSRGPFFFPAYSLRIPTLRITGSLAGLCWELTQQTMPRSGVFTKLFKMSCLTKFNTTVCQIEDTFLGFVAFQTGSRQGKRLAVTFAEPFAFALLSLDN
jgi:hypothetical protein